VQGDVTFRRQESEAFVTFTTLLFVALGLAVIFRFTRRRCRLFVLSPSESISTINVERSKRQTRKTREALAAATASALTAERRAVTNTT